MITDKIKNARTILYYITTEINMIYSSSIVVFDTAVHVLK